MLAADAFSDRFFDVAAKLDLHRLAAHAQLYLTNDLPMTQDRPVLAILEEQKVVIAVAAFPADACPGQPWEERTNRHRW